MFYYYSECYNQLNCGTNIESDMVLAYEIYFAQADREHVRFSCPSAKTEADFVTVHVVRRHDRYCEIKGLAGNSLTPGSL